MSARLIDKIRVWAGLLPKALSNTNATGQYAPRAGFDELLAVLSVGAMAAATTAKLELYEAEDAAGTNAALITGKAATVTANTLVNKMTLALSTVLATHTVTINGVTFTAHATVTTKASRQFSISGSDTADGDELAACINDADYGVEGVTATNAAGTITLTSTAPGEVTISASQTGATITIATVQAMVGVALKNEELTEGFTHVAAKVTTTATTVVSVEFIDTVSRYTPVQPWAATTE